jgi:hypothetical protein
MKQFRDMTHAEQLEWGRLERAQRMRDLEVRGAYGLRAAQDAAEARRKAIGATRSQAGYAVIEARRAATRSPA